MNTDQMQVLELKNLNKAIYFKGAFIVRLGWTYDNEQRYSKRPATKEEQEGAFDWAEMRLGHLRQCPYIPKKYIVRIQKLIKKTKEEWKKNPQVFKEDDVDRLYRDDHEAGKV